MKERELKTIWHVFLVAAALAEMRTAKTSFRKLLLGAAGGWHAAAAYIDWSDKDGTR